MSVTERTPTPALESPEAGRHRAATATLGAVRVPYAPWIVLAMCVLSFAALLYLAREQDFFGDEWAFVTESSGWGVSGYFVPHNEHWSTLPKISYMLLFSIFGMSSYLPFSAALLLVHAASAFVLFLIVRRQAGDLVGIAAAGLLLVVAHGSENIFWAFQIGFVGSIFFGLLAIHLLQGRPMGRVRPALASTALVGSLACSGVGLFFVPTVAADLWLDRARRRLLWVLVAPVVAYGLWFLAFGRDRIDQHRSPLEADPLRELVSYVPTGIGTGLAGMLSLGPHFGMIAFAGATAAFLLLLRIRPLPTLAVAAGVGLAMQYGVTGLVRAQFGDEQATASRYIYIATVFGLLIFSTAVAKLPFTAFWRPAIIVVIAGLLLHDAVLIERSAAERAAGLSTLEPRLQTAWLLRDAPGFDALARPDPWRAPTLLAGDYVRARQRLGSPYPEITLAELARLDAASVNEAVRAVLPLDLHLGDAAPSGGTCQTLDPAAPSATVEVGDGSRVWFVSNSTFPTPLQIHHWWVGDAPEGEATVQSVEPGQTLVITIADSGAELGRQLQLGGAPGTLGMVCHSPAS